MTIGNALRDCRAKLQDVCGEDAAFEAKVLLSSATDMTFSGLILNSEDEIPETRMERLRDMLRRRLNREPLQYILGEWSFYGKTFFVGPGTLIPRQDTELLVETAIETIRAKNYATLLDLCCGTGCIGVSVAAETGIGVTFSDISGVCIEYSRKNAARYNIGAAFRTGDLFAPLGSESFDIICINPPYLTDCDMRSLQPELRYEPSLALYGGTDGIDYYRRIADSYSEHLNAGGTLLMEIGESEGEQLLALFPGAKLLPDINGKPRVIVVTLQ